MPGFRQSGLAVAVAVGCSFQGPDPAPVPLAPEICDNCFDDNGNGLVDAQDRAWCGGPMVRTGGCSTTTPEGDVRILLQDGDCDFLFDEARCHDRLACTFEIVNDTEQEGLVQASCDREEKGGPPVLMFENRQDPGVIGDLVDSPLAPSGVTTIDVVYDCYHQLTRSKFEVSCGVRAEAGGHFDTQSFSVEGIFTGTPP